MVAVDCSTSICIYIYDCVDAIVVVFSALYSLITCLNDISVYFWRVFFSFLVAVVVCNTQKVCYFFLLIQANSQRASVVYQFCSFFSLYYFYVVIWWGGKKLEPHTWKWRKFSFSKLNIEFLCCVYHLEVCSESWAEAFISSNPFNHGIVCECVVHLFLVHVFCPPQFLFYRSRFEIQLFLFIIYIVGVVLKNKQLPSLAQSYTNILNYISVFLMLSPLGVSLYAFHLCTQKLLYSDCGVKWIENVCK